MKLGKLFAAELAVVLVALIVVVVVVEVNPALAGSEQSQNIGAFKEKLYVQDTVSIAKGESWGTSFEYSSYEPAILLMYVSFTDVQAPGYLGVTCNGRYVGRVYGNEKSHTSLSAISMAGAEWVKPPSAYSEAFTNQIIFSSDADKGFAGTFSYQISLKGSR